MVNVEQHFENEGLAVEDCVEAFGLEAQVDKAIEEFSELTQALLKHRYSGIGIENVIEEIADAHVMLYQLAHFYDVSSDTEPHAVINSVIAAKVARLKRRIDGTVTTDEA